MLRALYDNYTKKKTWWERLFFAMLEIALVNREKNFITAIFHSRSYHEIKKPYKK